MIKLFRAQKPACRCRPQWPALVTEMNGHVMPCQPSEHGSPMTRLFELSARCAECAATYPGNFVIEPGTPPPFEWAHEPKNTVCSCEPRWPKLMVKLRGQWYLGYPGTDGQLVVDGAAEGAFCDSCGAHFLGDMVVDPGDTSHLEDPDAT
ncbi:hypothetical protein [Micromonospora sp. NPDC048898]|uniref:hypothetical protein n=1 Tax=Micromonospora sp. NPDC048898 TaxID=3364260 RepID=UPI003712AB69